MGGNEDHGQDRVDLLAYAFDHVRNGLALLDGDGGVVRVNRAGAAILGRTPEDLLGTSAFDIVHPDDLEACTAEFDTTYATGHGGPLDLRVVRPDGRTVWVRAQATLLPDAPRSLHLMFDDVSAIHELTERFDQTTAALHREHEARVRRAKAFADVAALMSDARDLHTLIRGIAELAVEHIGDVAAVALIDEEDRSIHLGDISHRDHVIESMLRASLTGVRLDDTGPIADAINSGAPDVDVPGPLHPDLNGLLADVHERFPVDVRHIFPMQSPDGAVGAVVIARESGAEPLTQTDRDLAMVLASRAALAVRNVRLEAQRRAAEGVIQRRLAQQAAVAQLGTLAVSGAPLEDLAERCRKLVETTLGVVHCGVLVDDGHPDGLLLLTVSELFAAHASGFRYPTDPGLQSIFDAEGSIVVPDLRSETRISPNQLMLDAGLRSMMATKIESHSGARGVLSAASTELDDFTVEDATFMESLANVMASAIDAKSALDDLRHNALHDALTGLPNRVLVIDRLEVALEQAGARGTQVAVLACDLDRFKVVNDGLGHAAGDQVLRLVAERLRLQVRPGDTVGRFGGDEFIVVCPDVVDVDAVVAIAERLGRALREPMEVLGTDLVVTASIGIALGSGSGVEAASGLLRDADAAMYRGKDRGRARYELFDDDMRSRAGTRLRIETELRQAIEQDELVLHYQPVLDLATEAVVGVEALVRWQHPSRGLLGPAEFLDVANDSGLMPALGAWVIDTAVAQVARWDVDRGDPGWVAVNLAPRQLLDLQLLDRIDASLTCAGADPRRLRVEITEETLIDEAGQAALVLDALRQRGIGISVDDFGTGYSSLAYLKRLPVDALKLDRSFVAGVGEDGDDMVIAAAVIVMAQALGLTVVGEGVETDQQLRVLRAMGCDQAQGHLFGHPQPPEELAAWLSSR